MTTRRVLPLLVVALLALAPRTSLAAALGSCFEDEFDGTALDLTQWDVFRGSPTVSGGRLHLAAQPGTRADIQSRSLCAYGVLHAIISSSSWKSQPPAGATDSSFGFEHFTGTNGNCHYAVLLLATGRLGLLSSEPDAQGSCHGDPAHQEYPSISNWESLRAAQRLYVTLIWAPSGVTLHVTDGGSNSGTATSTDVLARPTIPLKLRLNADCMALTGDCRSDGNDVFQIDYVRAGSVLARPRLNRTAFGSLQTLRVSAEIQNIGTAFNADVYLGVLLPDGVTVCFVTSVAPPSCAVRRVSDDPATFQPLVPNALVLQGADDPLSGLALTYTFSGGEPLGTYTVFTALAQPGAFADHRIDPQDLRVISAESFTFGP